MLLLSLSTLLLFTPATTAEIFEELGEKNVESLSAPTTTASVITAESDLDPNKERYIVTCHKDQVDECSDELHSFPGLDIVYEFEGDDIFAIQVHESSFDAVAELTGVRLVEIDGVREAQMVSWEPIEGYYGEDDHDESNHEEHRNLQGFPNNYAFDQMQAREFWDKYKKSGEGVTVCVIDTGLASHIDLDESRISGTAMAFRNKGQWYNDEQGHGTTVTGTIMAISPNPEKKLGVAPLVSIHMAKIWDTQGNARASDIIRAAQNCQANGASVINMSIGGGGFMLAEHRSYAQMWNSGIFLVASAGNDGQNIKNYPAAYNHVASIGATDSDKKRAGFSNFNEQVDFTAPGRSVITVAPVDNRYRYASGTSYSSPYVAGAVALLKSKYTGASNDVIYRALAETAQDLGPALRDPEYGYGFIDVMAAAEFLSKKYKAPKCASNEQLIKVVFKTDNEGIDLAWELYRNDVVVYEDMTHGNSAKTVTQSCFPKSGCYYVRVYDVDGDGMQRGSFYKLFFDGKRRAGGRLKNKAELKSKTICF